MSVKYIPNGNVKIVIEKVTYQNKDGKNAVLPTDKIRKEELESLLKRRLIKKLELDETTGAVKKESAKKEGKPKKKPSEDKSKDESLKDEEFRDDEFQGEEPQE